MNQPFFLKHISKETLFQISLIGVLFLASIYDRHAVAISVSKILFFINYVIAALFICYYLLPRFFYKKNYKPFFLSVTVIIAIVVIIEELVLEKIFFPGTIRASSTAIIPSILDVLPIIVILVGFKFGWDAQQKQSELEQLNTAMAESRLQFLKSQINPHFLFNNLNNLYAYALENSPKTPKIILELSSLLRYMLYDCKEQFVLLEKEIQCLRDFIQLQELQIEDRGDIQFTVSGQANSYFIAPLILMVFVENCFKHSASSQSENIYIDIDLAIQDGLLVLQCENNFSPNSNTQELSRGIGLENVQSRLDLMYPKAHQLAITSEGNMFKVRLELKLEQ